MSPRIAEAIIARTRLLPSDQRQRAQRDQPSENRPGETIAWIVQTEHSPGARHEEREWNEQPGERRIVRECYDRESDRVERVPRGKAERIERIGAGAHCSLDRERPRAGGLRLQP